MNSAKEYTPQDVIKGGKDLVQILLEYLEKDTSGTVFLQKYINELDSSSGAYASEKEALEKLTNENSSMNNDAHSIIEAFEQNTQGLSGVYSYVTSLMESMKDMEGSNKAYLKQFDDISKQIKDITSFTNSIQDISSQTHLLSFNASIEAARAGQAGKGFRIIANEVKKLSENTSLTSEQIVKTVGELENKLKELSEETKKNTETLTQLYHTTEKTLQVFAELDQRNKDNTTFTKKIIDHIDDGTKNIEEVTKTIKDIENTNRQHLNQITQNATDNVIKINDLISFCLELDSIFNYLSKRQYQ